MKLTVTDTCIGCGICSRYCPEEAIAFQDSKPSWIMGKCSLCMRCYKLCPKSAIKVETEQQDYLSK